MSQEQEEPARKGRSNAILTYEKLEGLTLGISEVALKLDHMAEKVEDMKTLHVDHEVRIKALELSHAVYLAASNASAGTWNWVYTALMAAPATILAVFSVLRYLQGY